MGLSWIRPELARTFEEDAMFGNSGKNGKCRKGEPTDEEWLEAIKSSIKILKSYPIRRVTFPTLREQQPDHLFDPNTEWEDEEERQEADTLRCKILVSRGKYSGYTEVGEALKRLHAGIDRDGNWIVIQFVESLVERGVRHPHGKWVIRDYSFKTVTLKTFVRTYYSRSPGLLHEDLLRQR